MNDAEEQDGENRMAHDITGDEKSRSILARSCRQVGSVASASNKRRADLHTFFTLREIVYLLIAYGNYHVFCRQIEFVNWHVLRLLV